MNYHLIIAVSEHDKVIIFATWLNISEFNVISITIYKATNYQGLPIASLPIASLKNAKKMLIKLPPILG